MQSAEGGPLAEKWTPVLGHGRIARVECFHWARSVRPSFGAMRMRRERAARQWSSLSELLTTLLKCTAGA